MQEIINSMSEIDCQFFCDALACGVAFGFPVAMIIAVMERVARIFLSFATGKERVTM